MNKRRLAVPLLLLLAALAALIWFRFFHIGQFNTVIGQGAAESPDGAYQVTLSVCTAEAIPLSGGELLSYIDEHDLGPAAAPVLMVNKRYRYRITVLGRACPALRKMVGYILKTAHSDQLNRGVSVYADLNPMD